MESHKHLQLSIALLSILFISAPAWAAESDAARVVSVEVKKEADRILQDDIIPTLKVEASSVDGNSNEESSAGAVVVTNVRQIGLDSFLEKNTKDDSFIMFSGHDLQPDTVVTIIFPSSYLRSSTMADVQGDWSIQVPIDDLSSGHHDAMVQTIYDGVRSDQEKIAEFQVASEENLSGSTWVFLFSSVVAILCLLFAITLQLRHNMQGFSTDPLM